MTDQTPTPEALQAAVEHGRREERERIAQAIEYEASVTPCSEDAAVVAGLATLVRADFSYDGAERYEDENDRLRAALSAHQAENARLREALTDARDWHERQAKAMSKQPSEGRDNWAWHQHQEQRDEIDTVLEACAALSAPAPVEGSDDR